MIHPVFLSTPSARRATQPLHRRPPGRLISIHALREEGDSPPGHFMLYCHISIHALREEGDLADEKTRQLLDKFLSTPSARRATMYFARPVMYPWSFLSTPSARRATRPPLKSTLLHGDFYPRPPRGGRPWEKWRTPIRL